MQNFGKQADGINCCQLCRLWNKCIAPSVLLASLRVSGDLFFNQRVAPSRTRMPPALATALASAKPFGLPVGARARARLCVCVSIVSVVRDRVQISRPESCIVLWHAKSTANVLRAARCLGRRGVRPSYAYKNAPLSVGAIHIQPFHPVCTAVIARPKKLKQRKRSEEPCAGTHM